MSVDMPYALTMQEANLPADVPAEHKVLVLEADWKTNSPAVIEAETQY